MEVRELEFKEKIIGYRASFKNNEIYDISLQSAQDLHIYPLVKGPAVKLKQHDGLFASDDEIKNGVYAENLSNKEMAEKAKLKFLRRDPLIGQPLKVPKPDEVLSIGFSYVLDISSEYAFDLARIRIVGDEIHWTNLSLVSNPVDNYITDRNKMTVDCLYSKYMDQFEEQQTTVFNKDMVTDILTANNIWSRYYEVFELCASRAVEGENVIVYEAINYKQYYGCLVV
ncbi:hypothetical protein [Paenibacillus gallinarum]|uniref:Uncharacterized protein n=1 Tax=Paenibacillus gallinarum TaxID=2762232 RepID=A0ABR8T505_9BACL|nr:hypothetical protein [Paenibacillus gallinarum]MBD7970379.1 hypothetical protein [Paenibacillus gallinarum]